MLSMLDEFSVLLPTVSGTLHAELRPADASECGVVFFDRTATHSPSLERLYWELGLYFQSGGISSLFVPRADHTETATMTGKLLAAVRLLHDRGVRRVTVISAVPEAESRNMGVVAHAQTDFVNLLQATTGSTEGIVRATKDLVAAIRVVTGSVVGVVTLLVPTSISTDSERPESEAQPAARNMPVPTAQRDASEPAPAMLEVRLPDLDAHGGVAASALTATLSQLYGWVVSLLQPSVPLPALSSAPAPRALCAGPPLKRMLLARLQLEWDSLVLSQAWRDPERASLASEAMGEHRDKTLDDFLRAASRAWRHLDYDARYQWLRICGAFLVDTARLASSRPA